jgi:hypothetical protein
MAEATFTIRAVDATRQAFMQVQNSLKRIQGFANEAARSIKGFLGMAAVAAVMRKANQQLEAAEENAKRLGLTAEELDRLTIATDKLDQANFALQRGLAKTAIAAVSAFTNGKNAAEAAEIRIARAGEELVNLQNEAQNLGREFQDLGRSENILANEAMARARAMKAQGEAMFGQDPIKAQQKINAALQLEISAQKTLNQLSEEQKKLMLDLGNAQAKVFSGSVSVGEKIVLLRARERDIYADLALIRDDDIEKQDKQIKLTKDLVQVYEGLAPLLEEQRQLAKDAADMIAMGFEDAILSGQKLSDVLKNLAMDLVRLIFRNAITAPLAGAIGNFFGGFLAEGGPARAGMPYVVGEKGPELFVPGSSGTVIPNDRMGQMGSAAGGPTVNISYNIQSGVSRAELQPILEQERKRLMVTIPDLVRRGGSYRSAFA